MWPLTARSTNCGYCQAECEQYMETLMRVTICVSPEKIVRFIICGYLVLLG